MELLATAYPSQALAYQGTAYVCASDYSLGDSATLDNHNFEVQGFFFGSGINGVDADPAQVVNDFLTNAAIWRRLSSGLDRCDDAVRLRRRRVVPDLLQGGRTWR